ncbi:hypothetical protein Avbf_14640 [Armadillidium vulgare]|nr:hypothetical protein Avbf_14640 [Armadillidium vulgare]
MVARTRHCINRIEKKHAMHMNSPKLVVNNFENWAFYGHFWDIFGNLYQDLYLNHQRCLKELLHSQISCFHCFIVSLQLFLTYVHHILNRESMLLSITMEVPFSLPFQVNVVRTDISIVDIIVSSNID